MASLDSLDSMQRLVTLLKRKGVLQDPRVEETMLKVDRAHYNPSRHPYLDQPYPIGYGATISAPHMHAYALETLKEKLVDGAKVLDVGSGSGYLTTCMAHMVGPSGTVYGVEHIKSLVEQSVCNIRKDCDELIDTGRIKIVQADGRVGLEDYAPYDVIHVGASTDGLPAKLLEQLKVGGQMVAPVDNHHDQTFECIDKLPNGQIKRVPILKVIYIPLTDVRSQLGE